LVSPTRHVGLRFFIRLAFFAGEAVDFGFRLASIVPTTLTWNTVSGTWNTTSVTWTNGKAGNSAFAPSSPATFSSGSGGTISISGSIRPSAIIVSATSGTYEFVSSAGNLLIGSTGLAKSGAGTLVLSGSNSCTGATSVSGGKLLVNGILSSTSTTLATAAVLGGSGTISNAVVVGATGTLSPGNSPGILTANSLSLSGSAFTLMEIDGSGSTAGVAGTACDQVAITTADGLSYGGTLDLDFSNRASLFAQGTTIQLFSFSGTTSGDFSTIRAIDSSGSYANPTFTQSPYVTGEWTTGIIAGSGDQYLVFSDNTGRLVALPEPSAVAMVALGAGLAGWRMVRRRRGSSDQASRDHAA
jgi:autotransporter-associated beta strand protein